MPLNNPFEFFVQLHLTERCNLRCTHCYQNGDHPDEMILPEIAALIDEVGEMLADWEKAYGISIVASFNVTGGEPFLRRDIFDVLAKLKESGFKTYILTNGILISPDIAARLSDLGVSGVQISIEGPEEIHDAIRGKGSFAATVKGMQHLIDAGLALTLNTTLSAVNAAHFPAVMELASSLGAQRVGFSRLVPSGRGTKMMDEMLSVDALKDIYQRIFLFEGNGPGITTGDPIAAQLWNPSGEDEENPVAAGGCAAGISGVTILSDGTVTPCRRLPLPIGNIRKDSLREIWATSDVLNNLRDKSCYEGKCGTCSKWSACRGCRAIAFAFSQAKDRSSYLAEDPQCFISP